MTGRPRWLARLVAGLLAECAALPAVLSLTPVVHPDPTDPAPTPPAPRHPEENPR